MSNYTFNRLSEVSTWKGLKYSIFSLWAAAIDYYSISFKHAVLISALAVFIASLVLIFTSEHENTKTKIDNILYAMCAGLLGHDLNSDKK